MSFKMIENKKRGYLLIEILISIFIFMILIFVISSFMKRIVIFETVKKKDQIVDEKIYFLLDKLIEDIKTRDKDKFYYRGVMKNFHKASNFIIYKKNNRFYKLEKIGKKLYIYEGETASLFGAGTKISEYDKIKMDIIDNIFYINTVLENVESIKIVNLER